MIYRRSLRSSSKASVPFLPTGPFGGARSRRSPWGGLARPEATRRGNAEPDSSTGPRTATGLPRSDTSQRSPRSTRRRYREVLAKLPHAHLLRFHVYTYCSIFGQTLARLSRSHRVSENLR